MRKDTCRFTEPYCCSPLIAADYWTDFLRVLRDASPDNVGRNKLKQFDLTGEGKQAARMRYIIGNAIQKQRSFYAAIEPKLQELNDATFKHYQAIDYGQTDAMLRTAGYQVTVVELLQQWKLADKNVVRDVDDVLGMMAVLLAKAERVEGAS